MVEGIVDRGRLIAAMDHAVGAFFLIAGAIGVPVASSIGWLESHRLPSAVAVVIALKTTARVRLD
jgi:hypothetical protein